MELAADRIRGHTDSDQIVAGKEIEGFLTGHHTCVSWNFQGIRVSFGYRL